jgi:hypothetical protein
VGAMSAKRRPSESWWPRVPGVLLTVVALHQVFLAETANLNPWKGGGFGMFATTDHGSTRRVRAWRVSMGARERLQIPTALEGRALDVRQLPRQRDLDAFARALHEDEAVTGPVLVEVVRIHIDLDRGRREESVFATSLWPPPAGEPPR